MGEHIDKLTSDNEKLVNVSDALASDVKALQERIDKQDSELKNLKKERPTSEAGRTHVIRYIESHNIGLKKCMSSITTFHIIIPRELGVHNLVSSATTIQRQAQQSST